MPSKEVLAQHRSRWEFDKMTMCERAALNALPTALNICPSTDSLAVRDDAIGRLMIVFDGLMR